jgi:tRNA(fMet)-specific endonuclease VapC
LELVVIDDQVASAYVQIHLERTTAGTPMIDNDLWLAATAKAAGLVLVTRDRDFQDIDGLTVEDWTSSQVAGKPSPARLSSTPC